MKAPPFPPGLTAGDVVRCARVAQGIGLRAMCRATGMSPTALSHLETNRPGTSVSAETLALLARHLMLDPWELMLRDGRVPAEFIDALRRDPTRGAALLRATAAMVGAS